eukprot:353765-Chlamydomonas_euryale.AAC.2
MSPGLMKSPTLAMPSRSSSRNLAGSTFWPAGMSHVVAFGDVVALFPGIFQCVGGTSRGDRKESAAKQQTAALQFAHSYQSSSISAHADIPRGSFWLPQWWCCVCSKCFCSSIVSMMVSTVVFLSGGGGGGARV